MVVCKYFQQGYCRFGQNCRFDHVYGSKYSYHAPQSQTNAPNQTAGVTDEQLLNQVHTDVQSALKGGQWILSTYAPFKEKGLLPGLTDLSPEEARLFIYEAKANNNVDQAVAFMNNLFQEARSKHEQLLQPSPQILNVLRALYKGESASSPFTNQNTFGTASNTGASSVFRSAVQSTSMFDQNTPTNSSGFGQSNNVFGPSSDSSAKSIFAQATQSVFGSPPPTNSSNVFGPSPDAAKSIFAQANQTVSTFQTTSPPSNAFGGTTNPSNVFGGTTNPSNAFGATTNPSNAFSNTTNPTNVFGATNPSNVFGGTTNPSNVFSGTSEHSNVFGGSSKVFDYQSDDVHIYSKEDDLTAEDMEAFKSDTFTLGFIPEVPPPKSVC